MIGKSMEKLADHGQAMALAGLDAKRLQGSGVKQAAWRAAAVVEVSDQVEAVHALSLRRFTWNTPAGNFSEQATQPIACGYQLPISDFLAVLPKSGIGDG